MKKLLLSPLASPCSRCPLRCAADAVRRACAGRDAVTHRLHPLFSAQATLRAFVTMGMGRGPPSGRPISLPQGAIRPRLPLLPPWQEERAAGGRRSCASGQAPVSCRTFHERCGTVFPDRRPRWRAHAREQGDRRPQVRTPVRVRHGPPYARRGGRDAGRRAAGPWASGTSPDRNPPP